MAQIIKHRRGFIDSVKSATSRKGELIMATGSVDTTLAGPFIFVGNEDGNGLFSPVSKLYAGATAPTIATATYGSTLDGTPFYASGNKSLYILNNSNVGNTQIDLTGNIEGNTISGVTINNLESTNITASFVSGAFIGDATGLYNIPASGVTGLNLSKIYSGSVQVTTDSVTGDINIDATQNVNVTGSNLYLKGENETKIGRNDNSSYFYASSDYAEMYGGTGIDIYSNGGNLWVYNNSGQVNVSSYDGNSLELNTDGGEGDVNVLNSGGNKLKIHGDTLMTGSLFVNKIEGTGSLLLQPDQNDSRYLQIYNTAPNDVHVKASVPLSFFGGDTNYLKVDDDINVVTLNAANAINLYANAGNVSISSYDGSTLQLNTDGGEGNVEIGNGLNNINGYSNTTIFRATNYAQLESSGSYVFVESLGAHLQNDSGSVAGFTARPNGIAEITGSLDIYGDTQISGNTSVTGALVVANGSATFDSGLVAQNSNMLLTSGSNLVVQNSGNVTVDYIQGNSNNWNYLSLNGNGVYSQPGVELSSTDNISLWAEGGTVNVTGSLKVTGDITMKGNITIGDFTGDTINFNGEVSSSILPITGAAFDLGSSGQTWNNVWAETAHFSNISLNTISFSGLTEGRVLLAGPDGSIVDSGSLTYTYNNDLGKQMLEAPIIRATDDGNGTNFLIGNDMWLGDVNEANTTRFMGKDDNSYSKIYLNDASTNNYLEGNYNNVKLSSNNNLYLQSQNSNVRIDSFDGTIRLNQNSNNNVTIGGNTYINNDKNLYTNLIYDNTNSNNYLQTYGYGTNDSFWWESGNGADTTLLNNENGNNLNILQRNGGKVNIDAPSVNIHSSYGTNITGSLTVSDGSGVFNSSLIASNSDLYIESGSNVNMMNGAHLYFDTCVDMYYDNNDGNFIFHNDCNNFQFRNNVSITGSLRVSSHIYTDNINGQTNSNNGLHLNGGAYTPDVELSSNGQISLWSEGSGNNFAINMTGSVHMTNNLDVSGSLYVGNITNYNGDINGGGIYIDSGNYSEISYNDEESYVYVSGDGVWAQSNSGQNHFISNQGDTTISANNGHNVNINATNINLNGGTAVTGALIVSSGSMTSLGGDLYVSGNLQVLGSSTNVTIQSQTVDIGDNIILVNAYSPFDRYAGMAAYDSGSSGASGSFLWDSTSDYWLIVNANGNSSKIIGTTASTGGTGTEISLTSGTIPIATANNTIGNSLLTYSGTTLSYNTNKFTIDSGTGDTYISGNLTLDGGGSDNGSKTSQVTFRNDESILGFVSTTETTNELDGILGYNHDSGVLEFSTLIDGGTY